MNEIMAPAGEIIEALDYHADFGIPFPSAPAQIRSADAAISQFIKENNMTWPADFNNQQIADITIKYALEKFLNAYNTGTYKWTIRNAKQSFGTKKHTLIPGCINTLNILFYRS
ncbi:MAG: hypothetical protein LBF37_00245 [Rickettsiales bacterium]|jgi:hypothetical protein|nr:hypothetical protein [Rickettsiales bacterium]